MSKPILLMTHSLWGKMNWCNTAPESPHRDFPEKTWREVAFEDLDHTLLRKPYVENEAAKRGQVFEKQAYEKSRLPEDQVKGSEHFKKVVKEIKGGQFQKFFTCDYEFTDFIARFYGILDVYFPNKIIDLKTTQNFKNKYLGTQDELYRWLTGVLNFEYIVVEWDQYPKIKGVQKIIADKESLSSLREKVFQYTHTFIEWITTMGRYELYRDCYCHLGQGWKTTISRDEDERQAFYKKFWDKYEKDHQKHLF